MSADDSQPSTSIPQQRKISSRVSQFEQSSTSPATSAPTRTAPKAGNSLKDRIAMFSQPADAPIPVPPSHGLGLGIPPTVGGSVAGKGLYGNRIPSGSGSGGGLPSLGIKKTVENKGLIGNRIPSFQRGGNNPTITGSGPSSPQEGNIPAPRSTSSDSSNRVKTDQANPTIPVLQVAGDDLVPSTLPTRTETEDPGTPRSNITEPTETTPSLPSESEVDITSDYPISRTTSSISLSVSGGGEGGGGGGALTAGSTAVPSSMDVQSDTSSSRQLMHDVSGVSTPTGTPKMVRKGLEEDPVGAGPIEDDDGDMTATGMDEDIQIDRFENLELKDSETLLDSNAGIEDIIVPKSTGTPKPFVKDQDLPLSEIEESTIPDETPSAEKPQFIRADTVKESHTTQAPVEIEQAEETAAVMANAETLQEAVEAEVPVEIEEGKEPAIESVSKMEAKTMEVETPTAVVEPPVVGVTDEASKITEGTADTDTTADTAIAKETHSSDTAEDVAGKQMEVEPMPFVAPREASVNEEPPAETTYEGDKTPGPIEVAGPTEVHNATFPSVPDVTPADDADADNHDQSEAAFKAGSSSNPTTPIDPNFLKSFPSVPSDDESPDHVGQLGSPEGKVRVQVHVPASPNKAMPMSVASPSDRGMPSPRTSLEENDGDSLNSPREGSGQRLQPVRTAVEDAEDDGEAGWAKVQVKSKKYTK